MITFVCIGKSLFQTCDMNDYGMLTGVHDGKYVRQQFSVSEYPESYLTWIRWKGNRNLGDSSSDSEWFMSMERFIILLRTLFQDIQ